MSILNVRRTPCWSQMMAATIVGCTGLSAQAQPLDLPLSIWERLYTVRAGVGYKDNVALSHTDTEASGFFASGLEFFALRLPEDGTEVSCFVSADDRRYFSASSVDGEQLVFAQGQVKHVFGAVGEMAFDLQYAYQDQIQDVSVTETNQQAIRVRGHTLAAHLSVRLNFPERYWAGLDIIPTRQWLADPLDHYFEFGPRVSFGRDYGYLSEVSLRYEPRYRQYDTDPQLTTEGEPMPDTVRAFGQQEVALGWRHHWDPERHWRTSARVGYLLNTDNGSGYFDYTRVSGSVQVRYRRKTWEGSIDARVSGYDYAVQTVSATNSEKRNRTEFAIGVRAERQLTRSLRLVGAFEHGHTSSNVTIESYTVNTFTGTLQWEF